LAFCHFKYSKRKENFTGPKRPYGIKLKSLQGSLYDHYEMKSLLKEQEPQEVEKNDFNERK